MKKQLLSVFCISLILSSCLRDEYDFDLENVVLTPEIAVPILTANIVADDILSEVDSSLLREGPNNLLEFVYSDTVYSLELSEFVDIPSKSVDYDFGLSPLEIADVPPSSSSVKLDTVADRIGGSFKTDFDLANNQNACILPFPAFGPSNAGEIDVTIEDAPFETATFSEGILKLEIENNFPVDIEDVEIALIRSSDDVAIDTLRYDLIAAGSSLADSINMALKTVEVDMIGEFISFSSPGSSGAPTCVDGRDSLVVTVSARDLVVVAGTAVFPNQEVLDDTVDVDIELTNGEEFETLILKSGEMNLDLDYQIAEGSKLFIELPYATLNGVPFYDSIEVAAGPTILNESFDLSGYSFDLTKGGVTFNSVVTVISAEIVSSGNVVPFDTANQVSASVQIENLQPQYIEGYFGNQVLTVDADTQAFDIGTADVFENMSFADPEIKLGFHNSFGLPMQISTLGLIMKNDNEQQTLDAANVLPFTIASADISNLGGAVTSNLILNSNSNIADLINVWPNEVITEISGEVNPSGRVTNFALDTSKMDITLDLTVPIYGRIEGFNIIDTTEITADLAELFQQVISASLRTNVDNGFPLEAEVKFYITDENYVVLDSLNTADNNDVIVGAAIVDPASGDVVTNTVRQADLIASENAIMLMQNEGYHLILSATLNTANSGNNVKIYSSYEMDIKLGLLGELSVDLGDSSDDDDDETE